MSAVRNVIKEQLIEQIDKLPEEQLQEVLEFVGSLLSRGQQTQAAEPTEDLDPAQDPLLQFIGGVSHGSLAKDIDKELYGK